MFDLQQDWSGKGATLRAELEASERATRKTPARLQTPAIPPAFEQPLLYWQELHAGRNRGFGLDPLSWRDFAAYHQATGSPRFSEGVLEAIRIIDNEYFASQAAAEEHRMKNAAPKGGA